MLTIQKISDQSDRCWCNQHCNDAILSHTLLYMQNGVDLLSLKLFDESRCPGYLNFLWNYFRTHYIAVRWCTSKWTLGHRRKKGGGYLTWSPILLSNTWYTTSDKKITFFRQYSSYFPCQMNWKRNVSRQIVVAVILRFFKQAGNSRIWMLLLFKCFVYELANPLYLWVSGTEKRMIVFCVFFLVFIGQKWRVHTCMDSRFFEVCAIRVWTLM